MTEVELENAFETTCKCGAEVVVGYEDGMPIILHMMPMCEAFEKLDALAFLHHLRTVVSDT